MPKTVQGTLHGIIDEEGEAQGSMSKLSPRDYTKALAGERGAGSDRAELRQRLLAAERERASGAADYRVGYR